jgi:hypothetical protein
MSCGEVLSFSIQQCLPGPLLEEFVGISESPLDGSVISY